MKYCPNCGAKIKEGADVCIKCGKLLHKEVIKKQNKPIYANFGQRLLAILIDGMVCGTAGFIIGFICGFVIGLLAVSTNIVIGTETYKEIGQIIGLVISWLYFSLMESSSKQGTLGKLAMGIKVTDEKGNKISFGKATGRYFGKILSGTILCIGYLMACWTEKKQALHDLMAHTLVVNK